MNVIYQEDEKSCVACSLAWMANYLHNGKQFDWKTLFLACGNPKDGLEPSIAIKKAKEMGWIRLGFRIPTSLARIFLHFGLPVLIGVPMNRLFWSGTSWEHPVPWVDPNDEDHMVVLNGQDEFGNLQVVGWGCPDKQEVRLLDKNYPIFKSYLCL